MALSLSKAGIISTCIQGFLQGFAVFMFALMIFIIRRESRHRPLNRSLLIASSALIVLSTAEFISNIIRLVRGFITIGPNLPGGTEEFFASIPEPTLLAKITISPIQILILDGVVIYRAYVAWQNYFAIAIPGIGWCGILVSSIGKCYSLYTFYRHPQSVYAPRTGAWVTAMYSTTLATNMTATLLLAFRLWQANRSIGGLGSSPNYRVVYQVVIESGAIYTAFLLTSLFFFVAHHPMVYVMRDFIPPIISIVFNMIVVRVGLVTSHKLSVLGIEGSRMSTGNSAVKFGANASLGVTSSSAGGAAIFAGTLSAPPDVVQRESITVELAQLMGLGDNLPSLDDQGSVLKVVGTSATSGGTSDASVHMV